VRPDPLSSRRPAHHYHSIIGIRDGYTVRTGSYTEASPGQDQRGEHQAEVAKRHVVVEPEQVSRLSRCRPARPHVAARRATIAGSAADRSADLMQRRLALVSPDPGVDRRSDLCRRVRLGLVAFVIDTYARRIQGGRSGTEVVSQGNSPRTASRPRALRRGNPHRDWDGSERTHRLHGHA
jgi:hypothetical protein